MRASAPTWSSRRLRWANATAAAVIALAVLVCYLPALHGTILWDDSAHITRPSLQSLDGLRRIWFELGATQQYYPLLNSAFWIEHRLWGSAVLGYHLTNIVFHATTACLVAATVRSLLANDFEPGTRFAASWLAALLFAVHPVCVESVAWITEQKNTLSAVFFVAAALAYLRFDTTRSRSAYSLGLVLFSFAVMSKTTTTPLPAVLVVLLWWRRGRLSWRQDVLPLAPWFALGIISGLFTAWVEQHYFVAEQVSLDGSVGVYGLNALERVLLAARIVLFYLGKNLWPQGLMFTYPRWTVSASDSGLWLDAVAVAAITLVLAYIARRRRGPLAGFLIFLAMAFPVLGFFNVYSFRFSYVADHFQYLATLGILVPTAVGVVLCTRTLQRLAGKPVAWATGAAAAALIGLLVVRSSAEAAGYHDSESFYRRILARNPQAWMAHNNLGLLIAERPGAQDEALEQFQAAVRLEPENGELHNQLGSCLSRLPGRSAEAISEFETAIRLSPSFPYAHLNLAIALLPDPAREPEVISHLRTALAVSPNLAQAHLVLGLVLERRPDGGAEAIQELETATRLEPDSADAHTHFAIALTTMAGAQERAAQEFEAAVRLEPQSATAHYNLGCAFLSINGREESALKEFDESIRLDPTNDNARVMAQRLRSGISRRSETAAQLGVSQ